MNVNLGTLEINEKERRAIGGGILATREKVRDWAFALLIRQLKLKTEFQEPPVRIGRQERAKRRRGRQAYTEFEKALRKKR